MSLSAASSWVQISERVHQAKIVKACGHVVQVIGLVIEGSGPPSPIGDMCLIKRRSEVPMTSPLTPSLSPAGRGMGEGVHVFAEVVGFRNSRILLMPLGEVRGIEPGCPIVPTGFPAQAQVGLPLLGRVIDGLGQPIDQKGLLGLEKTSPLYAEAPHPLLRARISEPIDVGIRAVNGLLTVGKGQRVAIFSGSGVGKSTLLGMMARHTRAQANVVALIGERGREVREFIEKDLGEEGLKRSVVVVATSDQPPLLRMRGAYLATAIAEYLRDQGLDVLLMMDSITRFAMASREVGLAIGEPPTTRGYTPSLFAQLPRLLERVGMAPGKGSITGIYNVLVEGDDITDPIVDAVRSIVDGHIVLSRELANQGHYPSIDVLGSISRVMADVVSEDQLRARHQLVSLMAAYKRAEDLIQIGAYVEGSNAEIDEAIRKMPAVNRFLRQGIHEKVSLEDCVRDLKSLFQ